MPRAAAFLGAAAAAAVLLGSCGVRGDRSVPLEPRFTEVAAASGIAFQHWSGARGQYYYVETFGSGGGFLDYDGDGWQDVYLVNGADLDGRGSGEKPTNRLYRNLMGAEPAASLGFADVTAPSGTGDPGYGMGCAAADYDGDGDQDLYITNYGPNVLLENQGDGSYRDVTASRRVGDARWGTGCGFLDYDGDGDLDLFAANFVDFRPEANVICSHGDVRTYCDPTAYEPAPDILYRNDGGAFTEVTGPAGVNLVARGLGVTMSDFDRDGDTDLYVANDGQMNFLYRNDGGRFTEVGLEWGVRFNADGRAEASMGVHAADFDGNGFADIAVASFSRETNTVYCNTGQGYMADVSSQLGVDDATFYGLTFGLLFLDYDNDMDLDLFAANGHVLDRIEAIDGDVTYAQADQLLANTGERFADVTAASPDLLKPFVSRAAAAGDIDNDGDVDLLVTTSNGPARLLRNDGGNRRGWLTVVLTGASHPDAVGARVEVTAGGRRQVRERVGGGSYLATHDPRLHFGLGSAPSADVVVYWPGGGVDRRAGVPANRALTIRQSPR